MESLVVECLHCRVTRLARRNVFRRFETPECPHCGYLGWAPVLELTGAETAEKQPQADWRRLLRSVA